MKNLFPILALAALLSACASNDHAPKPRKLTTAEAIAECIKSSGTTDRALFDACMKDKGYQRKAMPSASAETM
ncbi:hypothetical protein [Neisseria animalis]|uniref:Entry exclusion lipoprotein TrbK n=1 Tax=Neisseria animalis TaxID=492 RepID=A0A5P3MT69_NEIAN|nr:hypothetical protein [Neisseria animalis]QEY24275.1 hypothetical protein D0T90_07060 [Neisseria animalis]ROW32380.1 hypothetical protein CGZ60_05635 [Neisseria animalis]VEE06673.1 Uncharacterised protein [Neisseria animalis]